MEVLDQLAFRGDAEKYDRELPIGGWQGGDGGPDT